MAAWMPYRRVTGHRLYSIVSGIEYHPFDIASNLPESVCYAMQSTSETAWRDVDCYLREGYNFVTRKDERRPQIVVVGVMTNDGKQRGYRQFNLCVTHSRIAEDILEKMLFDIEYHLSVVLWPLEDAAGSKDDEVNAEHGTLNMENYHVVLCSPKNSLKFSVTDVNRRIKSVNAVADEVWYRGIAPPYIFNTSMVANMFHKDFGSEVIKRYKPNEEVDIPLDSPKKISFGRTDEATTRRLERYVDRQFGKRRPFDDYPYAKRF